jgi:hypothetical protein
MNHLPAGITVSAWNDLELTAVAAAIIEEQHQRALEAADIDAIVKQAFQDGFTAAGMPRDPWLHGGLLVCCGTKIDKSATSHECAFVAIGERWVWESESKVYDVVRNIPGPKPIMRSVSVCTPWEGMELDLVVSRMRTGVHQMKQARSFLVREGKLELVATRVRDNDYRKERS